MIRDLQRYLEQYQGLVKIKVLFIQKWVIQWITAIQKYEKRGELVIKIVEANISCSQDGKVPYDIQTRVIEVCR